MARMPRPGAVNALTVDVEDYFQVSALAPYIRREDWDTIPTRVEANVDRLLAQFARHRATGTFFTLGWIAQRHPALVRRIVAAGHELASHGHGHLRAGDQSAQEFLNDIRSAKARLEDIAGVEVIGYRAPSFSIDARNEWAFDCLQQAGYRYSSSVYPVRHDHYGMPDASRVRYAPRAGLAELPLPTVRSFGRNFPAGGGGYFRLLPYPVSRWLIGQFNRSTGEPAIFYMHPWEIDPGQPRVPGTDLKTRFRHYVNLHRVEARLDRLLSDFAWDRIDRLFALREPATAPLAVAEH
jgi:polysaccharide deacetylase family protein (PEP-CTERM system associated)